MMSHQHVMGGQERARTTNKTLGFLRAAIRALMFCRQEIRDSSLFRVSLDLHGIQRGLIDFTVDDDLRIEPSLGVQSLVFWDDWRCGEVFPAGNIGSASGVYRDDRRLRNGKGIVPDGVFHSPVNLAHAIGEDDAAVLEANGLGERSRLERAGENDQREQTANEEMGPGGSHKG
jgi:hypothetical protein